MSEMPFHPVARILPPEEWAEKTPEFLPLPPEHAIVVVVEDGPGGRVLGRWGAMTTVNLHGLEIVEEARTSPAVAGALLREMVGTLLGMGILEVLTTATTPEVEQMIQTAHGRQIEGTLWVIPLKEGA